MVRRFRRAGRRRARRLRRLRRSRRYYGRRRFRRSRRYRRRRGYGRRRRFYSRKGAKTAIAFLTPAGYKKRTYRYWLSKSMMQDNDGGWRSGKDLLQVQDPNFTIVYGKTYTWQEAFYTPAYVWTGPGNMYSVTDIPTTFQRALGFDCYTIIHLSWFSQQFLQAIGYYTNQARLTKFDLHNYSFYKPISVSVKLIPRFPKPPSKFAYGYPKSAEMNLKQPFAVYEGSSSGGNVHQNIALDNPVSTFSVKSSDYEIFWDDDAMNLIGYIIPLTGTGVTDFQSARASTTVWNSLLAGVQKVPSNDFLSSFRKAGYSRATLSQSRPTRFTYKFTRNNIHAHLYRRNLINFQNINYQSPYQFWESFWAGGGNEGYTPFDGTVSADGLKNNWIPADLVSYRVFRSGTDPNNCGDAAEVEAHYEVPIDAAVVFIPGITTAQLMARYNVQFSYTCAYAGRTYDMS